jgi:hypothetical protein
MSHAAAALLPVERVRLVTAYPRVSVTGETRALSELCAGRPAVLHLYTG